MEIFTIKFENIDGVISFVSEQNLDDKYLEALEKLLDKYSYWDGYGFFDNDVLVIQTINDDEQLINTYKSFEEIDSWVTHIIKLEIIEG